MRPSQSVRGLPDSTGGPPCFHRRPFGPDPPALPGSGVPCSTRPDPGPEAPPMRLSTLLGRTTRQAATRQAAADTVSHDLLHRAGYVRQHAAGIYTYLTLGLRALRRLEAIVREEMDATGAQEIL